MSKTKTVNGIDIHTKFNPDTQVDCRISIQLFGKPEWEFKSATQTKSVLRQIRAKSVELYERLQEIADDVDILVQNGWRINDFGGYYDVSLYKYCKIEDGIKDLKGTSGNVIIEEQQSETGELLRSYPAGYIEVGI